MKLIKSGIIVLTVLSLLLFVGCSTESTNSTASDSKQGEASKKIEIGIIQIVEHPALDSSRQGFIDALKDAGYEDGKNVVFDYQNAQGSRETLTTIAQKFKNDNKDLIFAIATPSAQAAAQQTNTIPILITAVTDPVVAGVVKSMEKPETNVTGTTDMNPVKEQLALIKRVAPAAKKVGIIYNTGEPNSEVQVQMAQAEAPKLGLEIELVGITNSSEVKQAADSIVTKVDAIYVPTDNTVVASLDAVLMVAEDAKIPVIVGEGDSVKRGGIMTFGLDYYKLGYQTGEMALRIIKDGAKPEDMPIETQNDMQLYINKSAAKRMGVTIPQDLIDLADELYE